MEKLLPSFHDASLKDETMKPRAHYILEEYELWSGGFFFFLLSLNDRVVVLSSEINRERTEEVALFIKKKQSK